ncbi:hypothetical protein [Aureliella helgolandensis]|uniref:Peptidase C39-like domain-containing protein n=1 Tax=Aureliella helgolandensis TaxID=2527968 RepID=A0A518G4U4_9BACT|nr:hypothetical protein [Aureliella helgolandensis]QDV23570.1 hypothetical protein Q31a_18720 [Aureliella helgolandensis]
MRFPARALLALILVVSIGCDVDRVPEMVAYPAPPPEIPVANLPASLRQTNWEHSGNGQGSCVHASSCSHFRWQGKQSLAAAWRREYAGGETAYSILTKWRAEQIPFVFTENGEPSVLEWASDTRRGAIIWYYPQHCVTFCGFSEMNGVEYAFILDNNRTGQFLAIEKHAFLRAWRSYGGFAAIAVFTPTGPLPWPAYIPKGT